MTNAEKYLKDGETGNFVQAFSCWYYGITRELKNADKMLVQFLKEEAKPTLTEDERVILRNIDKRYKLICKDNACNLFVKNGTYDLEKINPLNKLFQFIKERRRISYKGIIGGKIMLKLKSNVTYQKLIGIGFRSNDWDNCYDYEYGYDVTIAINKDNRELTTYIEEYSGEYRELAVDEPTSMEQLEAWCPKLIPLVELLKGE